MSMYIYKKHKLKVRPYFYLKNRKLRLTLIERIFNNVLLSNAFRLAYGNKRV